MPVGRAADVDKGWEVIACVVAHVFVNCLFRRLDEEIADARIDSSYIFEASYEGTNVLERGASHDF